MSIAEGTELLKLRDVTNDGKFTGYKYFDLSTGQEYSDPEGLRPLRKLEATDVVVGEKGQPIKDAAGNMIHISALSDAAYRHYGHRVAEQYGHKVPWKMRDETGRLVTMDLGPADVHTPATLSNYAAGYHLGESVADVASPVVMVPKQSDVYYTWDSANDFKRKIPNASSSGGEVAEINPTLSSTTYTAVSYALGGFLPTEVQTNADTPLQPFTKMTQVIVDGLRLEREYRVKNLLQTSGTWDSSVVNTLLTGSQWNGGTASDPVANLHLAIESSYMPVTAIVMSELVWHDFLRNPSVQKYFTYKDMVDGLPDPSKVATQLKLPPIHVSQMKYYTAGAISYMWGNHVVLLHQPSEMPPTSQMEIASNLTFRWMGGTAPDGSFTGGLLVRAFFDQKRGPRGGTKVVSVISDIEVQTSKFVGGLILNAHR